MKQVENYLKVTGKLESEFCILQMKRYRSQQAWKEGFHLKK